MIKKKNATNLNYKTLTQIKLAARVLKEGFWMGDIIDFLESNKVRVVGNPTNTSKWLIAKLSLQTIKNKKKLDSIFELLLNNKHWYYHKPTKVLKELKEAGTEIINPDRKGISLSFCNLHALIKKVSKKLFYNGHYSQAIFEAYKAVVNEVKKVSQIKNLDGKPLMERVFSINNPIIKFNKLQTLSEKDEQVGLMFLFIGASLGIRNPKAHDNIIQKNPIRTLEYLIFASILLKRLDERIS